MSGHYRMHRGWMDNPVFGREPYTRAQAWCWLIERAAWKDGAIQPVGRHNVRVQRGQIAVAVRYLAEAWQWSKSTVDRFLTRLETGTMIRTEAGTQYSVISICNYDKYQADADFSGTQVGTDDGTRVGHEWDKEERRKEGKKDTTAVDARVPDAVRQRTAPMPDAVSGRAAAQPHPKSAAAAFDRLQAELARTA